MKFWLREEDEFIYLDQLIKATGAFDNYPDIRRFIDNGHVRLNGRVEKHRRKMLVEGDEIRYRDQYIKILGNGARERDKQQKIAEKAEPVIHTKGVVKWTEKPLKSKKNK